MQVKLHRWAAADGGRRFDDLFNLVCDPATLLVAFERVAGNTGANTPGVDGLTAAWVERSVGVPGFLDGLRSALKDGGVSSAAGARAHDPKPGGSGKVRRLGIPDRRRSGGDGRSPLDLVDRGVGGRHPRVLGLDTVDQVAEDPAAPAQTLAGLNASCEWLRVLVEGGHGQVS